MANEGDVRAAAPAPAATPAATLAALPAEAPAVEHPAESRLRKAEITQALLIDDAYDEPTRASFRYGEIEKFWLTVEDDEGLLAELQNWKKDTVSAEERQQDADADAIVSEQDIDSKLLRALWDKRDAWGLLAPTCRDILFHDKLKKREDVDALAGLLRSVGVEPVALASKAEIPDSLFKLIFLDFYLGIEDDNTARENAKTKAREIYDRPLLSKDKPFIVLMSSKPDVSALAEYFRKDSKLLSGLFGYVPKTELRKPETLYLKLAAWATELPARHDIQRFAEALEKSVERNAATFIEDVRSLGFEDYANIQWLSLNADGHPLGDYMLWMYKSYLAYLVHDDSQVLKEQATLDAMTFREIVPGQEPPSAQLAKIYRCALTEPGADKLTTHPWLQPTGDPKTDPPYLNLGDIFIHEDNQSVRMVATAGCDLAYAPGTDREYDPQIPVYLLPGKLLSFEEPLPDGNAFRTELFELDGKRYRILWDHKHVGSQSMGDFWAWTIEHKYALRARLSLPFALELQQAFTANVGRVGVPVKPPMYRFVDVEVLTEADDGTWSRLGTWVKSGGYVLRRKVEGSDAIDNHLVLLQTCVTEIADWLDRVAAPLRARLEQLSAEADVVSQLPAADESREDRKKREGAVKVARGQMQGVEGKLGKVDEVKKLSELWLPLLEKPHRLPAEGAPREVDARLLRFYLNGRFEGKFSGGQPIVLNVRYTQTIANDATRTPVGVVEPVVPGSAIELEPEEPKLA
jgi:hypothetical protein